MKDHFVAHRCLWEHPHHSIERRAASLNSCLAKPRLFVNSTREMVSVNLRIGEPFKRSLYSFISIYSPHIVVFCSPEAHLKFCLCSVYVSIRYGIDTPLTKRLFLKNSIHNKKIWATLHLLSRPPPTVKEMLTCSCSYEAGCGEKQGRFNGGQKICQLHGTRHYLIVQ